VCMRLVRVFVLCCSSECVRVHVDASSVFSVCTTTLIATNGADVFGAPVPSSFVLVFFFGSNPSVRSMVAARLESAGAASSSFKSK
jgi:hypothetical protein